MNLSERAAKLPRRFLKKKKTQPAPVLLTEDLANEINLNKVLARSPAAEQPLRSIFLCTFYIKYRV